MADWTAIGRHRYRIQDDVLCFETVGDFSADEMRALNTLQMELVGRYGYALFFVNNREPGMLSSEARRAAIENNRQQAAPWSMALIGFEGTGAFLARTAVLLAAQGIRLITGRRFYLEFFSSEEQATSWLDKQRQHHRAEMVAARAGG
jgi:hypothetical protein